MKKLFELMFILLIAINFSACFNSGSDSGPDDDGYSGTAAAFLHYTLPDQYNFLTNNPGKTVADEAGILFSTYTLTSGILYNSTPTYVTGYTLDQFINKAAVNADTPDPENVLGTLDARKLYAIVMRSNQDGFDNRTKFLSLGTYNYDLRWDIFIQGFLLDLNYSGKTFFPSALGLPGMYSTKYAYDIYMFRKIDVKKPNAAGTLVTFEVGATTDSYVNDSLYTAGTTKFTVTTKSFGSYTDVKVISLDQFLTLYVTDTPSSYTYKIVALDDTFKEGWTYTEMQSAYYLPDYDLIIRVDASNNIVADTKINFPVRIELIGAAVEYDGVTHPAPAYASYE